MQLKTYIKKPKLVVLIVIDQFRSDYLTRFHSKFKAGAGFDFLMSQGAYFPFASYDFLQSMTCPGHATIATGANPQGTGIPLNGWHDQNLKRFAYCVDDGDGPSPRRLKSTTFSDEVKLMHKNTKVVSVSLKDRSAIMLGGHQADLAAWLSSAGQWETSSFYKKGLPQWVAPINEKLKNERSQTYVWKTTQFEKKVPKNSNQVIATPFGMEVVMDFAEVALKKENLGKNNGTQELPLAKLTS